jgi:hypothetical protein
LDFGLLCAKFVGPDDPGNAEPKTRPLRMTRFITSFLFLLGAYSAMAQTQLRISNVTLTEHEDVRRGPDLSVTLSAAEGGKNIVLFADQDRSVDGKFKVVTHNVRRSSVKQGAVYLRMTLFLKTDGKKNKRIVQKTFYAEDDRITSFSESFIIKDGIDVRKITLAFDGRIQ